jgi:OOP family OmpA-OmpF porin
MKNKLLAVALLSALSAPAFADDAGFFLGLDYSALTLGNLTTVYGANATQPSGGYRLDGGYNFNKNWGVELGYFGNGNASDTSGNSLTPNTTYVAGVGTLPLNDMFDIFGKVGVAMNQLTGAATVSCTVCGVQTGIMYGVGADFNFNKQVGIRLQYESLGNMAGTDPTSGSQITASDVSLGVMYKF